MLDKFLGQRDAIAPLLVAIASSERTGRPLPHALILGGSGRGKTTLARAVADDMRLPFATLHGSSTIERGAILERILEARGGILHLDEAHALPRQLCEELFRLMDDGKIAMPVPETEETTVEELVWYDHPNQAPEHLRWQIQYIGAGYVRVPSTVEVPTNRTRSEVMDIGPITVIASTTDEALLPEAFYSRLSALTIRLRPYKLDELADIAAVRANEFGITMDAEAALEVAKRARSTPRLAKQLTERAVDWVVTHEKDQVQIEDAIAVMSMMGVDEYGMTQPNRDILNILKDHEKGLSRTSLAQQLRIPPRNMEHYWGELAEAGFVTIDTRHKITEKGRSAYGK